MVGWLVWLVSAPSGRFAVSSESDWTGESLGRFGVSGCVCRTVKRDFPRSSHVLHGSHGWSGLGQSPQRLLSPYTVPYDQVRTVEFTPIITGQICALREGDRNLNRVKQGIYLSDLNVGSLDSDGLESSGLSLGLVRDDGILV